MLKEYETTIEILRQQKQELINQIKGNKTNILNIQTIIEKICFIDNKIEEYTQKISNQTTNKNKTKINFSSDNIILKNSNIKYMLDDESSHVSKKNLKKSKKKDKYISVNLEKKIIQNILDYNGKINITSTSKDTNIETIYTFKNETKNNYFYQCNRRPKCDGKAKFDKKLTKFYITHPCTDYDIHNKLSKTQFNNFMDAKNFHLIDFKIKKNQTNLLEYIYKHNTNIDTINIIEEFRKYTKCKLLLNNKEISRIKCQLLGKFKGITILECLEKIKNNEYDLEIMSEDVKYDIKLKNSNKITERKQKIIIFGNKSRLNLMNNKEYIEYFIDITFKVIPKCYRPYKLLTIATLDKDNIKTILVGFILFIYKDSISFLKIFEYLNNIYNFNPTIIHSDYEIGIELALKKAQFFKNDIIHLKCFFHFSKAIREKLKKFSNEKKYLSKNNYVILKNIELICFISEDRCEGFKKFIIDKLIKSNVNKSFIEYLQNFWFKKNIRDYNYSYFIEKFKENDAALNKLYLTNNILESLHSKINNNLPHSIPNKYNFIKCMKYILLNDLIKNDNYKRYDFVAKSF